jgi:hypothetical protein
VLFFSNFLVQDEPLLHSLLESESRFEIVTQLAYTGKPQTTDVNVCQKRSELGQGNIFNG